jgi:hypothetical protein
MVESDNPVGVGILIRDSINDLDSSGSGKIALPAGESVMLLPS